MITISRSTGWLGRIAGPLQHGWIIDQLRLEPYQHVLALGIGAGRLLEETALTLRIGFIAGIEASIPLYHQACRRNRRFITRQLMTLHAGQLEQLPYPPHYFHTVYGTSAALSGKNPSVELSRLARMLRSKGRLILLFQPKGITDEAGLQQYARRIRQDYAAAGLARTEAATCDPRFGATIAVTGIAP